ncbi:aminotransferase class III-fold pyridoxal phosphate-dependent enzyme [Pseudoteredinibacter isoporae]|nr:aminotransferase class III-fold pyridoxal phosphate-dependent enzyme [Pseudoteredinibacter isoporae]NIB25761.1 aminotransferase class III-fold pyridoxal phosphate-dependent enzyme [Pseudoteredinibacter isoporae]
MSMPAFDNEQPLFVERSEGVHVYDNTGKQYLDGLGGLWCVNVGHSHPKMVATIQEQAAKLAYYNTFGDVSNRPSVELAEKITGMLKPEGMSKVFFTSGGSDSVETALKLARHHWRLKGQSDKTQFISLKNAYHGVHFGGTSLNGMQNFKQNYGPLLPGCSQVDGPFPYRNPWTNDLEELGQICADILERKILHDGANNIAAFIAEPIQGAGGVIVPPANYWPLVREICDKYDILLIADEVVTGFGRSGSLFGVRGWGVAADIQCFAKGISSGYIPLGATVINDKVAEPFLEAAPNAFVAHGYTYSGHPLACAVGLTSLNIVEEENLVENAGIVGDYLLQQLQPLVERHEHIGEARGKGLMAALDLVTDKQSKTPVDPASGYSDKVSAICQENGVLIRSVGPKIILSPPLTFTKENVDTMVNTMDLAFSQVSL